MRLKALGLVFLLLVTSLSGCLFDEEKPDSQVEELRLNDLTMKGTHNSYHVKTPGVSTLNPENNYTHTDLDIQADRLGVRQFELDVYYVPGMGLRVYHTPLDPSTNCDSFTVCMNILLNWSIENPTHAPLWIFVEPKDFPFAVDEFNILQMINDEITSTWPAEKIIRPTEVQGDETDLRTAIITKGWPTLEESRGKTLFVLLDKSEIRDQYIANNPQLENQTMFAIVDEDHSLASVISFVNPMTHGERLREAAEMGFMVRTRPDEATVESRENNYSRFELALNSGANFITTDFPGNDLDNQYAIWLPEGPVMCNQKTAPPSCTTRAIEGWGNYTPISNL